MDKPEGPGDDQSDDDLPEPEQDDPQSDQSNELDDDADASDLNVNVDPRDLHAAVKVTEAYRNMMKNVGQPARDLANSPLFKAVEQIKRYQPPFKDLHKTADALKSQIRETQQLAKMPTLDPSMFPENRQVRLQEGILQQQQAQTQIMQGLLDQAEATDKKTNITKWVAIFTLIAAIFVPLLLWGLEANDGGRGGPAPAVTASPGTSASP